MFCSYFYVKIQGDRNKIKTILSYKKRGIIRNVRKRILPLVKLFREPISRVLLEEIFIDSYSSEPYCYQQVLAIYPDNLAGPPVRLDAYVPI